MTDTTSDAMLAPCPFCGGNPELDDHEDFVVVRCACCGISREKRNTETATLCWNTRAAARPAGGDREAVILAIHEGLGGNGWAYSSYGGDELNKMSGELGEAADTVLALLTRPAGAGEVDGRYQCLCGQCGKTFNDDNKRRVICDQCKAGKTRTLGDQFESIIAALNYDGSDTNSLTVGEIRRALPAAHPAPSGRDPATIEAVRAIIDRHHSLADDKLLDGYSVRESKRSLLLDVASDVTALAAPKPQGDAAAMMTEER